MGVFGGPELVIIALIALLSSMGDPGLAVKLIVFVLYGLNLA